ncbi:MAG: ACP S-malonyltransferase [Actinobacteria bacterium]|nr:ACP S-malonyltransferase [Actinomycetota bacterium]
MLAIIAPGQGSQTPGFLSPWLAESSFRDQLVSWSEEISLDLVHLGTDAGAEEIRSTSNAQPLLVSAGLLAMKALGDVNFSLAAGHSVGEITAAAITGVLTQSDALALVRERGLSMEIAATSTPTGMSAVLGGDRDEVVSAIQALGLTAANENGAGQIVAAGDLSALAVLGETPPAGARVRALTVAGAFHTSYMQSAIPHLENFAKSVKVANPRVVLLSNKDGESVSSGQEVLDRIVAQVANPVRWDLCMITMKSLGVTGVIELPPAGTLVGILKRALPDVETLALKTPDDISAARDLIARHEKVGS